MHKSLTPLLLLLLLPLPGLTQEFGNTMEVDRTSYALYERSQWKELVRYARKARNAGFDFHYLRYRLGIAYYELGRYRPAVAHFEKVTEDNPDDRTAAEYLYYAYLRSGRQEDARMTGRSFDEEMRSKLGFSDEARLADGIAGEYKHYRFDDFTSPFQNASDKLDQKVRKSLSYTTFSLTHLTRSQFSLFHAVSFLWGLNRVYDPARAANTFDENLRQFQYYIAGNWHLGKGLDLTAGFHYIRTTLEGLNPAYTGGSGSGIRTAKYLFIDRVNSWASLMKLSKSVRNFNFRLSGVITDLNAGIQYQPSAGLDYYPLGNTHLYLSGDAGYLLAPDEGRYTPGAVFKGRVGFRVTGPLWLESFGQYGRVSNYADEDAYVIYNSNDVIEHWYGARVNIFLSGFRVNLYYIFQQYQFTNYHAVNGVPNQAGYGAATHLAGVRWKMR